MISKNDLIKAIIKAHLEILERRNQHNKVILKIITVILAFLVIITLISIIIASKIIGTTVTQIIYGVFLILCLVIIIVRNDLKEILLEAEKDLKVLKDYEKEIEVLSISSKLGAAIPSSDFLATTLNLRLSETYVEFRNLINLLNRYLPSKLLQEDINTLKNSGMHFDEDSNLFGESEGYRITYV